MKYFTFFAVLLSFLVAGMSQGQAVGQFEADQGSDAHIRSMLAPHKALYDIKMVETRSGSQVINISGKMYYEWKSTCEAWVSDHRFTLFYEYADAPGMKISSDFSTYETFDGETLNFSARRSRDSMLYQELRGQAQIKADKVGLADFTMPEDLSFELEPGALFPMGHTLEMIKNAKAGKKFFQAEVFDGSDEEGPVEINTFIGKPVNAMTKVTPSDALDMSLLNTKAWTVRMAVFPLQNQEGISDYEMNMVFHENGIISDMYIDYEDFSVTQKLVALEPIDAPACGK